METQKRWWLHALVLPPPISSRPYQHSTTQPEPWISRTNQSFRWIRRTRLSLIFRRKFRFWENRTYISDNNTKGTVGLMQGEQRVAAEDTRVREGYGTNHPSWTRASTIEIWAVTTNIEKPGHIIELRRFPQFQRQRPAGQQHNNGIPNKIRRTKKTERLDAKAQRLILKSLPADYEQ